MEHRRRPLSKENTIERKHKSARFSLVRKNEHFEVSMFSILSYTCLNISKCFLLLQFLVVYETKDPKFKKKKKEKKKRLKTKEL